MRVRPLRWACVVLGQWYVCLLLGAFVAGESWRLTCTNSPLQRGWITARLREACVRTGIIQQPWGCGGMTSMHAVAIDEAGTVVWNADGQDLTPLGQVRLYAVSASFAYPSYGLWTMCFTIVRPTVTVTPYETSPVGMDRETQRRIERLDRDRIIDALSLAAAGDADSGMIAAAVALKLRLSGRLLHRRAIAHDAGMLGASIGSVAGLWLVPRRLRASRRRRRTLGGLCARCGHSLNDLPTCPECGTVVDPST